jgi:aminomethyltransferase
MAQKTPLHSYHLDMGADMMEFAGYDMPKAYKPLSGGPASPKAEHLQVRSSGGLFDVSHMGRLQFKGVHVLKFLEKVCTRKIRDMKTGQCRYSLVCNEQGGVKDDVIVMRQDEDSFMMVVNASNRAKIVEHFKAVIAANAYKLSFDDVTDKTAMVAVQGPRVIEFIGKFSREIPTLKRYTFTVKNLLIAKLTVARTGYTGEDGVEVILPASMTTMAMKMIMKDVDPKAADAAIKPAGLVARDTLRIEAGMPLYGHELGEEINALSCGVDFAIGMDKDKTDHGDTFIGMEALKKTQAEGGPAKKLVGLRIDSPRQMRQGMAVLSGGKPTGTVTSGCLSPTLNINIAMAFVDKALTAEGTTFEIDLGEGKGTVPATVVKLPFYKKPS